ncbi:MAG: fusion protein [Prevotella sp.]|jgi:hypothetical protein|nr:fusion protein [Prevotella sp.]
MTKVFLSGVNARCDTGKQAVAKKQVIQMCGYEDDRYVVYDITEGHGGLTYHLINLRTKKFGRCDMIRPLSQKSGIGYYFDEASPQFISDSGIAILREEAENVKKAEAIKRATEQNAQLRAAGRERLKSIIPAEAKAVIIAELHRDESDLMTDYHGYSTIRTVILGFSMHTRDLFPELRRYAANFPETAYLTRESKKYEHREKYSMGAGYYLGESKYRGWIVRKAKHYRDRESMIDAFALTAGDEANIRVKAPAGTSTVSEVVEGCFTIVDYSEKALAVFGDTKTVKGLLKELGGRFNPQLTHEGIRRPGWVFSKNKGEQLRNALTGSTAGQEPQIS